MSDSRTGQADKRLRDCTVCEVVWGALGIMVGFLKEACSGKNGQGEEHCLFIHFNKHLLVPLLARHGSFLPEAHRHINTKGGSILITLFS